MTPYMYMEALITTLDVAPGVPFQCKIQATGSIINLFPHSLLCGAFSSPVIIGLLRLVVLYCFTIQRDLVSHDMICVCMNVHLYFSRGSWLQWTVSNSMWPYPVWVQSVLCLFVTPQREIEFVSRNRGHQQQSQLNRTNIFPCKRDPTTSHPWYKQFASRSDTPGVQSAWVSKRHNAHDGVRIQSGGKTRGERCVNVRATCDDTPVWSVAAAANSKAQGPDI